MSSSILNCYPQETYMFHFLQQKKSAHAGRWTTTMKPVASSVMKRLNKRQPGNVLVAAQWLRPLRSPNLAPCNFCFWGMYTNDECLKISRVPRNLQTKFTAIMNIILTAI
jgi:hypothetical protein